MHQHPHVDEVFEWQKQIESGLQRPAGGDPGKQLAELVVEWRGAHESQRPVGIAAGEHMHGQLAGLEVRKLRIAA